MVTTTFVQQINGVSYTITVPQHRVETICDRVDRYQEKGNFAKALDAIQEFLNADRVEKTASNLKPRNSAISKIINEHRHQGRYFVMQKLVDTGMSKANAYYHVRKADIS